MQNRVNGGTARLENFVYPAQGSKTGLKGRFEKGS